MTKKMKKYIKNVSIFVFNKIFQGSPNMEIMEELAKIGGGRFFASRTTLDDMKSTYKSLAALLEN